MTITIIIVLCWILYKTGKAAAMLEHFRLYPTPKPATAPPEEAPKQPPAKEPQKVKTELPTLERMQKETIVMNILSYNQVDNAPDLVKRLSDSELKNIIDRFMSDLEV